MEEGSRWRSSQKEFVWSRHRQAEETVEISRYIYIYIHIYLYTCIYARSDTHLPEFSPVTEVGVFANSIVPRMLTSNDSLHMCRRTSAYHPSLLSLLLSNVTNVISNGTSSLVPEHSLWSLHSQCLFPRRSLSFLSLFCVEFRAFFVGRTTKYSSLSSLSLLQRTSLRRFPLTEPTHCTTTERSRQKTRRHDSGHTTRTWQKRENFSCVFFIILYLYIYYFFLPNLILLFSSDCHRGSSFLSFHGI